VASLITEHFGLWESTHDAPRLERAAGHATDELAERTVWCAAILPDGRRTAHELEACLVRAGGCRAAGAIDVEADGAPDAALRGVRDEDVVVLHDVVSTLLTEALREQGAHPVWHLRPEAMSGRAWAALEAHLPALDACVLTWSVRRPDGRHEHATAFLPAAGVVADVEVTGGRPGEDAAHELAWRRALAGVVHAGHAQHVGGLRHACPAVAVR
jgi:hypothetical protein